MNPSLSGRRCDYDVLRAASMTGVVFLHCAAGTLRSASGIPWHFANLLSSLATAAVPLFFMLSGALLLSQEKTADLSALPRRLVRILIPLLVWSLLAVCTVGWSEGWNAARGQLLSLLSTPAVVPYWFLYALVPIYLISPFLRKMADALSPAQWNYLLALWFLLTIAFATVHDFLPVGSTLRTVLTQHWTLNLNFIGGYLGYFLLGARLVRLERLPSRSALCLGSAVLAAVIALGSWRLWAVSGVYDERFKSYQHLFAALLAALLFLLIRSCLAGKRSGRGLIALSGLSFGVYLSHPLAIKAWEIIWPRLFGGGLSSAPGLALFFLAVLLSCLLGTVLASSVPILCFLLTGQRFQTACRESNLLALPCLRRRNCQ